MASLTTRLISAFIALGILFSAAYFFGAPALLCLCVVTIILTIIEYTRVAFLPLQIPPSMRLLFMVGCVGCFWALTFKENYALTCFGAINCLLFSAGLWFSRNKMSNENILHALALASAGMLYCVVLPSFAARTLFLTHGIAWLFSLLVIVFFGDVFAYFGGYLFGKQKLMPALSPNKTIEGAFAGAFGSLLMGVGHAYFFLPHVPLFAVAGLSLLLAFVAQSGDLFASLVKRVAQVKDSGTIMPGHGGALDRFDGIYFAAPLLYAFASYFDKFVPF